MSEPLDLIPARMLNELVYCPRLFYLEHVAGEWEESADTIAGKRVHRRVDAKSSALPAPNELPDDINARSVTVSSETEGIIAKLDLIEAVDGAVTPVDYKRGAAPDPTRVAGGVWPADRVQMGAQLLALRDAGYQCNEAVVYYAASKTRVRVPFDTALEGEVRAAVVEARRLTATHVPPPPLIDSPKCPGCSLVGICLPDETNVLLGAREGGIPARPPRRLIPSDDDRHPCHVQAAGATVGKAGEVLEVRFRDGTKQEVRTRDVSHLSLFGKVQVTAAALQELCSQDVGVSFFTAGGWYYGDAGPTLRGERADTDCPVSTRVQPKRLAAHRSRVCHGQDPELPHATSAQRPGKAASCAGTAQALGAGRRARAVARVAPGCRGRRRQSLLPGVPGHAERDRNGAGRLRLRGAQPPAAARSRQCPAVVRLLVASA